MVLLSSLCNLVFSGGKKCCAGDVSAITVRIVLNVLIIALESWTSRALPVMSVSTMTAKQTCDEARRMP